MIRLDALKRLFLEGRLSRREFMGRAAALGATAALSQSLLATPLFAETPKPRRGGRFRIGVSGGSTTDSIDPAASFDMMTQILIRGQLGNSLVEIDHKNKAVPELAESWDSSADANMEFQAA